MTDHANVWHRDQLPAADGLLYHPVRTGARYLETAIKFNRPWEPLILSIMKEAENDERLPYVLSHMLRTTLAGVDDDPARVFAEDGFLAQTLETRPLEQVLEPVARAFGALRLQDCLDRLRQLAFARGWAIPRDLANVALGRAALQSSTAAWSKNQDPARDAEGVNDGNIDKPYGCHTRAEKNPWWQVDLKHRHSITRIAIRNRLDRADRLSGFLLQASDDGSGWHTIHSAPADKPLDQLIEIEFTPPHPARFLRVMLPHHGNLHIVSFEAFGGRVEQQTDGLHIAQPMPRFLNNPEYS